MPRLPEHRRVSAAARRRALLGALTGLALAAACDVPTDLPEFETRWVVPAEATRFGVGELLPAEVTVSTDATAFIVDFDPTSFSSTLGELCPACLASNGQTVPKPAFSGTFESQVGLPNRVYEVSVVSGLVTIEVENLFGFDPLRPAAGAEGTITLRVTDSADGDVLTESTLDGADTAFPVGSTLVESLTLSPSELNGDLVATIDVTSPLGDPITVDASTELSVLATPSNIRVGSASIDVASQSVTFDPVELDLEDIDADIEDAIVEGAFLIDVTNPFGVGASYDLTIDGPTISPILRSGVIGPEPESTLVLSFTGDELRSFLGEPGVLLTGGATVDAGAGIVSLSPAAELVLDADLDLTLLVNGGGD